MPRRTSRSALAVLLLACAAAAGQDPPNKYAVAGVDDDRLVDAFVAELRRAVARDDRRGVAAMIRYPIVVWAGALRVPVADAETLVARYDAVFTPALKAVVATGALAATSAGIAIGPGLILVAPDEHRQLKIADIRIPMTSVADPASAPRAGGTGVRAPGRTAPRRVIFQSGRESARMLGSVSSGAKDTYLVWAAAGSLLDVRIEGVRGLSVVVRVFDAGTGKPVDARADRGLRVWTGRVPSQGDCRIEVSHAGTVAGTLDYSLVVTRR